VVVALIAFLRGGRIPKAAIAATIILSYSERDSLLAHFCWRKNRALRGFGICAARKYTLRVPSNPLRTDPGPAASRRPKTQQHSPLQHVTEIYIFVISTFFTCLYFFSIKIIDISAKQG
jgi:hypothetical protein